MRPQDVPNIVRNNAGILNFNCEAISILEGNIKPFIEKAIDQQLSPQSAFAAKQRLSPINILPKIIDKLTNIYQTNVIRTTDQEQDKKLVDWYEEEMEINPQMNCANEFYNLSQATLIQPYVYAGKPYLRPIPNDKFIPYSENIIQPNIPTHIILIHKIGEKTYYTVYSDTEIYIVDAQGNLANDLMIQYALDGSNPIGKIPFIYGNSSKYNLIPCPDEDGLTIVKLIPVMLTDLNHAAMFQSFSILYMINGSVQNLKYAPNAMWEINGEKSTDNKPEIGQIKPQVDYTQVMDLIQSQIQMWLGTKGIRASTVGNIQQDNFASGISKVIDEMDTYEARQKQVSDFTHIEKSFWDLIINYLHPYWTSRGELKNVGQFTTNAVVSTKFAVQLPMQTRGAVVTDLETEVNAGFTSRKRAIAQLNPELTEKEIDELIVEIDDERTITLPQGGQQNGVAKNQSQGTEGSGSYPTPPVSGPSN